jgi:hypothetical protein
MAEEADFEEQARLAQEYCRAIASMTIDEFLDRWRASGWTGGLPDSRVRELEDRIRGAWVEDPSHAFYELAEFDFDTEGFENADDYQSTILGLAERSQLEVQSLNTDEDGSTFTVTFTCNGRPYTTAFEQEDDWFNTAVLDLLNHVVAAAGTQRRWLGLPVYDQFAHLVLVSETSLDAARDLGVVPSCSFFAAL